MTKKKTPAAIAIAENLKNWAPPDACPECGNPMIIPVYERQSIACPECRKEIPCK